MRKADPDQRPGTRRHRALHLRPPTQGRRRNNERVSRLMAAVLLLSVVSVVLAGCVVDSPSIESTASGDAPTTANPTSTVAAEPTSAVRFEPTATPAPPTPTVEPTATTPPEPTATIAPAGPTPLPLSSDPEFEPVPVDAGPVAVPVRGATFILDTTHPVLQLAGHTLIYFDDSRQAEVDIFIPAGDRTGAPLDGYDDVVGYLEADPAFEAVIELTPVSIAGLPTRVFEGDANSPARAFVTDLGSADDETLGWFPPVRMRLWLIDHPDGPVIVSAETFQDPALYTDAVRLATGILSTIDFG